MGTAHLLFRETIDWHAQKVIVICRCAARGRLLGLIVGTLVGVVDFSCDFRLCHLRKRPELLLTQFLDDVRLLAVGDHQLLADDHLYETRLVRQFLELRLQLVRKEVLEETHSLV